MLHTLRIFSILFAALGMVALGLPAKTMADTAYAVPVAGRSFRFPADHGSHPTFQTEWWYFTGNLWRAPEAILQSPPEFGFELTFFRRRRERASIDQDFLAHAAISDYRAKAFKFESRSGSGLLGLAGAQTDTLAVWNREWRAEMSDGQLVLKSKLTGHHSDTEISLNAALPSPIVPQGDGGFSKKGECPSCASYYYSMPLLRLTGEIRTNEQALPVVGLGWMDHEFMSSALAKEQVGWDWFALRFKSGEAVMLFRLRATSPSAERYSGMVSDGEHTEILESSDFSIKEIAYWRSPSTGARYPSKWEIALPRYHIRETLTPLLDQQELFWKAAEFGFAGPSAYWEGGIHNANDTVVGYAELTGYSAPLNRDF